MTTMLDKLIEAIVDSGPVGCCTISERKAKETARAALQAIRDGISVEVYTAGQMMIPNAADEAAEPGEVWRAMIDKILEEKLE